VRVSFLLVVGTDTGVGKTWVCRALAHALTLAGRRVGAIKPVETGCSDPAGSLEDGVLLAAAAGQLSPSTALRRLATPVAPAVACELEGVTIDFDELVLEIEAHAEGPELVLVEGAGGILSPITWEWNIVDLGRALDARVLLVASDRLGAVNHTLLALSAIELAGLELCGVALTAPAVPDRSSGTNAGAIARLSGLERVTALPRAEDPRLAVAGLGDVLEWLRPAWDAAGHAIGGRHALR
jgi:dethiobiotin synthetase